jgi:hypothetical protein
MDPHLSAFLFGLLGSVVAELALATQAFNRKRKDFPHKYRNPWFWVLRALLAIGSGGVAMAYYSPAVSNFLYVHIGVATPVIVTQMSSPGGDDEDDPKP